MKTERDLITQMLNALDACRDWPGAHNECTDAVIAARAYLAAPEPHVGDSRFESWFSEYGGAGKGTKQQMRDAYAAGMGDKLAAPEQSDPVVPKCGAIIEVFGKDWRLEYLSLPVGRHKLYVQEYVYTHPVPQPKAEQSEPVAWVLFRKDDDGLQPIMFYGGKEKPEEDFKDRFELHGVWTTPQPKAEPVNQMLLDIAYEVANAMPVNASQHIVRIGTVEAARAAIAAAEQAPQQDRIAQLEDLLGKANALARIRQERIAELTAAQPTELSDEELNKLANKCTSRGETGTLNYREYARAVLAAQKEKATCSSDEWLANCPQSVRDLANKIKQEMK